MTEEELVIFDILTRPAPELSTEERAEVKKVARELLNRLKQLLVLNWRQRSTAGPAQDLRAGKVCRQMRRNPCPLFVVQPE